MARRTKKPSETRIYIGRTLPGLQRNTVFSGGKLPAHVAEMAEENVHIRGLIVPINDLQEARRNMRLKGHILNFHAEHLTEKEL